MRQIDLSTGKIMHIHRSLQLRSAVPQLYFPRYQGGRAIWFADRVWRSSDPLLGPVRNDTPSFWFEISRMAKHFVTERNSDEFKACIRSNLKAL